MHATNRYGLRLLWRQLSLGQVLGFFVASLVGLSILLVGLQFYHDVEEILGQKGQLMRGDQIVLSKRVSSLDMLSGSSSTFGAEEVERLGRQPFVRKLGAFMPAQFRITAGLTMGVEVYTYMFFEAVPDSFLDVSPEEWSFDPSSGTIPIIIPRTYLTLYNAAFAQSQGLPQISEKAIELLHLRVELSGMGLHDLYRGRIVGFSDKLNTLLVPEAFMTWANDRYASGTTAQPSRLVLRVDNPADADLLAYIASHGYQVEGNALDSGEANYLLRLIVLLVGGVGLVISLLALYMLILSIYLVLEKNATLLEHLLLLGYSRLAVGLPYWLLSVGLFVGSLGVSLGVVAVVRTQYMQVIERVFPTAGGAGQMLTALLGLVLIALMLGISFVAIMRRVMRLPAYPTRGDRQ